MDEYYALARRLPDPYAGELLALDPQIAGYVQEIRLRVGQAVQFTIKGRLTPCRKFLPRSEACAKLSPTALHTCFTALCRYSVYAYEQELSQGYFTIPGGNRVGVAGIRGPHGFSTVTSLNLRVARWITCPLPLEIQQQLSNLNGGILVAGAPGSGKTTFLRSMITWLGRNDRIFCVVDERGELLAGEIIGLPKGAEWQGDVYTRWPKPEAIAMALRCMNPQAIICDELGTDADVTAVEEGLACGVVFLASVHCEGTLGMNALEQKPKLKRLLDTGAFANIVFLDGRVRPGSVAQTVSV